jgi:hypothetical protein
MSKPILAGLGTAAVAGVVALLAFGSVPIAVGLGLAAGFGAMLLVAGEGDLW